MTDCRLPSPGGAGEGAASETRLAVSKYTLNNKIRRKQFENKNTQLIWISCDTSVTSTYINICMVLWASVTSWRWVWNRFFWFLEHLKLTYFYFLCVSRLNVMLIDISDLYYLWLIVGRRTLSRWVSQWCHTDAEVYINTAKGNTYHKKCCHKNIMFQKIFLFSSDIKTDRYSCLPREVRLDCCLHTKLR